MTILKSKARFVSALALIPALLAVQNCSKISTRAVGTVEERNLLMSDVSQVFSKAIVDEPPALLLKTPGSPLNEAVLVDEDRFQALGLNPGDLSFYWKNENTGAIASFGENLILPHLTVADSGRYQLYVKSHGQEQKVQYKLTDVFVSFDYQVPAQSLPPPVLQASIASFDNQGQKVLLKVTHKNPGQIKSVTWNDGATALNQFNGFKAILLDQTNSLGSRTLGATVTLEDQSVHNLSVQLPLSDVCITGNCPTLCEADKAGILLDGSGVSIQKCLMNGLKLGDLAYVCGAVGSVFSPLDQKCKCPAGTSVQNGKCVIPNSLQVAAPPAEGCVFNGATLAHDVTVTAYASATVKYDQVCQPIIRTCMNGTLTGSGNFVSCAVTPPRTCTYNNQTVAHGASVMAFLSATVPFGQTCGAPELRTCTDGTLSGSGTFTSCTVLPPVNCNFNNTTVTHGNSVTAFAAATVPFGQTCTSESRSCFNGTLSGTNAFAACTVQPPANCTLGTTPVSHNTSITAFATATVPFGQTCTSESRSCFNGTLSGTNAFTACTVSPPANCTLGTTTVTHNTSIAAYPTATVPFGGFCSPQSRFCFNGALSGTNGFATCTVQPGASCTIDGKVIPHGGSVDTFFQRSGYSCSPLNQTCDNGTLPDSSSYPYTTCNLVVITPDNNNYCESRCLQMYGLHGSCDRGPNTSSGPCFNADGSAQPPGAACYCNVNVQVGGVFPSCSSLCGGSGNVSFLNSGAQLAPGGSCPGQRGSCQCRGSVSVYCANVPFLP